MTPIEELQKTVERLRAPGGCSWDQEQTHESLIPCLIEECSEVIEAIDNNDFPLLEEELGDLLLSVLMHAQIAQESGRFNLDRVAQGVNDKLIRRHPHVFGPNAGKMTTDEVLAQWETIKKQEKAAKGLTDEPVFKDLPPRLPALHYASDTAKRIRKKSLPTTTAGDSEPWLSFQSEEEVGKALFALATLCDQNGWDAEGILRKRSDAVREEVTERTSRSSHG
ncbi:MAG: MazG family protein [Verrucomicrobiota bacterium]